MWCSHNFYVVYIINLVKKYIFMLINKHNENSPLYTHSHCKNIQILKAN